MAYFGMLGVPMVFLVYFGTNSLRMSRNGNILLPIVGQLSTFQDCQIFVTFFQKLAKGDFPDVPQHKNPKHQTGEDNAPSGQLAMIWRKEGIGVVWPGMDVSYGQGWMCHVGKDGRKEDRWMKVESGEGRHHWLKYLATEDERMVDGTKHMGKDRQQGVSGRMEERDGAMGNGGITGRRLHRASESTQMRWGQHPRQHIKCVEHEGQEDQQGADSRFAWQVEERGEARKLENRWSVYAIRS
ncbi:hypothetical protein B0H10DRAFT_1963745 [Mycena sp. CBHHK59/15]|nr:hypothetical protein B0H10DRAFT_1963745 [Mycena sp. CBHHK59/15]